MTGNLEREMHRIVESLRSPQRILVTSHTNPDGDAIGASLALTLFLEACGHRVTCFNGDPIADPYVFLPGADKWQQEVGDLPYEMTLVIDVYDLERTGLKDVPLEQLGKIVVLDHHRTSGPLGDFQYVDPEAAAAGILVYRLAKAARHPLSRDMAENIYCCILTDTGSFRYSSANPESFRVAAEMVELGVEPWKLASRIFENRPLRQLNLLARVLQTLAVSAQGRVAMMEVDQKTLTEFAAGPDLTDGFINYARSIRGVEVAIFLRETPEGFWKASLRSVGRVDVSRICERFGGGGHRNAAGCTLRGDKAAKIKELLQVAADESLPA